MLLSTHLEPDLETFLDLKQCVFVVTLLLVNSPDIILRHGHFHRVAAEHPELDIEAFLVLKQRVFRIHPAHSTRSRYCCTTWPTLDVRSRATDLDLEAFLVLNKRLVVLALHLVHVADITIT